MKYSEARTILSGDKIYHCHIKDLIAVAAGKVESELVCGILKWRIPVTGVQTTTFEKGTFYITGLKSYCWTTTKPNYYSQP